MKNNPSDSKLYNLRELKLNFSGIGDESDKGLFIFREIKNFEKINSILIKVFTIEKKFNSTNLHYEKWKRKARKSALNQ